MLYPRVARVARRTATAVAATMTGRTMRWGARLLVARRLDLRVEGLDLLPRTGPVLVVARHFHHLYDGAVLIAVAPRPVHIFVALDWVRSHPGRWAMERLCGAAGWPVVLRADGRALQAGQSAYRAGERGVLLRHALRDTTRLLREGRLLVIFPEAYPNVDPGYTPKTGADSFLPFDPGFAHVIERAQRRGGHAVAVVPAGFHYERGDRWRVTLRFGAPRYLDNTTDRATFVAEIERSVRRLSTREGE